MTRSLAALALVLAVLTGCGDDDDDDVIDATTTTATTIETSTTTSTTEPAGPELVDPAETARTWIAAIADGDDDAAIALTAPRSLAAFGGAEGFRDHRTDLAEGWGAWDFAPSIDVRVVEVDGVAVVALHGEIAQEGPPEETWDAMPVVATEDGDRVEPFLDLGHVEMDPPGGVTVSPSLTFSAYVLGNRDVTLIVDGETALEPEVESADGDQQRASIDVSDLEPGLHAITVLVSNDDGVMTRTFMYSVER